jgi:glycosyltransferase involved in cell wall biosynthesis
LSPLTTWEANKNKMEVFCSTIIPTINRPTLSRAVQSVREQAFEAADFEVIVVNDSGRVLPHADWQHSKRVRVINTNRHERSVARNAGAAIARGKYLHFLDDDDVLLPGALAAFWKLHYEANHADWLYGSYQTVDNLGNLIEEIHPGISGNIFALLVASEGIPIQASLLNTRQFFNAGAFDPTVTGVEDRDLGRRMALSSTVAYTPAMIAQIRIGEDGSTTRWAILAEDDRQTREKALNSQDAFARLQASANSRYWRGRVSRAYLGSTLWNLRRKKVFTAASRVAMGLSFAGWNTFSPSFWRGLGTRINCWPQPQKQSHNDIGLEVSS